MRSIRTWLVLTFGLAAIILVLSTGLLSAEDDSVEVPLPRPTDLTYALIAEGVQLNWTGVDAEDIPSGLTLNRYKVRFHANLEYRNPRTIDYVVPPETSTLDDGSRHEEEPTIHVSRTRWYSVFAQYQDDSGETFDSDPAFVEVDYSFGNVDSVTMSATEDGVTVSWTAPPLSWESDAIPVSHYLVSRLTLVEGTGGPTTAYPGYAATVWGQIATVDAPEVVYQDTDVVSGAIYAYVITARFSVFQSASVSSDDFIVVP